MVGPELGMRVPLELCWRINAGGVWGVLPETSDGTASGIDGADACATAASLGMHKPEPGVDASSSLDFGSGMVTLVSPCGEAVCRPGDRFRIHLHVHGKWRWVTWQKEDSGDVGRSLFFSPMTLNCTANYYLCMDSRRDDTEMVSMTPDDSVKGLYHTDITLTRPGGMFQISVNKDHNQMLHPDDEICTKGGVASGPSPAIDENSHCAWCLYGRGGDCFRIGLQLHAGTAQVFSEASVSWRRIATSELSSNDRRMRYSICGSGNDFADTQRMLWSDDLERYYLNVKVGPDGYRFFILQEGDWSLVYHPMEDDSAASFACGPDGNIGYLLWFVTHSEDAETEYTIYFAPEGGGNFFVEWALAGRTN